MAALRARVQQAEDRAARPETQVMRVQAKLHQACAQDASHTHGTTTAMHSDQPAPSTVGCRNADAAGKYNSNTDCTYLMEVASTVILKSTVKKIDLKQPNGRRGTRITVAVQQKEVVLHGHIFRRKTRGERLLNPCVGGTAQAPPAAAPGDSTSASAVPMTTAASRPAVLVPVDTQVSFIASLGITMRFNKLRLGYGGAQGSMASIPDLRSARMHSTAGYAKRNIVTST